MFETITLTLEELEQIINENIELGIQLGIEQATKKDD